MSSMINAFSVKWPSNIYIFPPLPLINKVITKFISDSVNEDLLITPFGLLVCGIPPYVTNSLLLPFPFLQVMFWTKRIFSQSGATFWRGLLAAMQQAFLQSLSKLS